MQRNNMEVAMQILVDRGIANHTTLETLKKYPSSAIILFYMENAGIFSANFSENKIVFANLKCRLEELNKTKKPDVDGLAAFVDWYKLLGDSLLCLLTPEAHKAILNNFSSTETLMQIIMLFHCISPSKEKAAHFFFCLPEYLDLFHLMTKVSAEEITKDCFTYLFEKQNSKDSLQELLEVFKMGIYGGKLTWFNLHHFKQLINDSKNSWYIMSGFKTLEDLGMLECYSEALMSNPKNIYQSLGKLERLNLLSVENALLVLINPDFERALDVCESFGYTDKENGKIVNLHTFYIEVLRNINLTQSLCQLAQTIATAQHSRSFETFSPELDGILARAGISLIHTRKPSVHSFYFYNRYQRLVSENDDLKEKDELKSNIIFGW